MFARFRKCDFQTHSPRDPNWIGIRPIGLGDTTASGRPATEADVALDRAIWAASYVNACVERGLKAVALTDHHEMVMVECVLRDLEGRESAGVPVDLWVFPGMELTVMDGRQCIILFDAKLPQEWWQQAQGALGIPHASLDRFSRQGKPPSQLALPYTDLGARLDAVPELKGRYIILPNVSEGGSYTVVSQGRHQPFASMPYVGGYADRGQKLETCGSTHRRRLSGDDAHWGKKFIYPLPTSDAREEGFPFLGGNDAWIKLSEPTTESVRQAFLAWQSRLCTSVPLTADVTIESVTINGANPLGDLTIDLSTELNTVIGGRGSGKSTLLEYIAFGIGRSCFDLSAKSYPGRERLQELVKDTIIAQNGSVSVTLLMEGARFEVVRSPLTAYRPSFRYPNGKVETITDKDLRALVPAVVYSQGELSELGSAGGGTRFTDLLSFIDPTYKRQAEELHKSIGSAASTLDASYRDLANLWRLTTERGRSDNNVSALRARITALESGLPKMDEADQAIVDRHAVLLNLNQDVTGVGKDLDDFDAKVQELSGASALLVDVEVADTPPKFEEFGKGANALFRVLKAKVSELAALLSKERTRLAETAAAWQSDLTTAAAERDEVLKRIGVHKAQTEQITERQREMAAEIQRGQEISRQIGALGNPSTRLGALRASLKEAVSKKVATLRVWSSKIEDHSDNTVVVEIDEEGDFEDVVSAVAFAAERTRSQEAVRNKRLEDLAQASGTWKLLDNLVSEAAAILNWKLSGSDPKAPPQFSTFRTVLGDSEAVHKAFVELMDLDKLCRLAKATPEPRVLLKYRAGGQEIAFEKASEGQRASALLMMLIKQGGGPLLIDQPESDLDNAVVTKIVDLIHTMKDRRQIIFATHNANLVVNGAAELVVVMANNENGRRVVERSGAIDDHLVNERITETMEGGEQAFRDRQRKYGF